MAKPILITSGEPAGIGPDLCVSLLAGDCPRQLVVMGSCALLKARAAKLGVPFVAADYAPDSTAKRMVWDLPLTVSVVDGKPSPQCAEFVLAQLQQAAVVCLRGDFAALLTAPVSKQTILAAGIAFTGQTEYLAQATGIVQPLMLLAGPRLRTAVLTTHLPLAQVATNITELRLSAALRVLHEALPKYFPTHSPPRIFVCGLNPHAGEGGYLGGEEPSIIIPAINKARAAGMDVHGPFSADTVYADSMLPAVDCVLAMYHDQALPVSKLLDFDETVNVTLGLPFLRVSPDHGIAADLAGSGKARLGSMQAALELALRQ